MKLLIAAMAVATLLFAADPQAAKPPQATKPPAPKVMQPLQIPAGATESEPGTFRYTDAHGKKWIYRKTPFGVARLEDTPAGKPAASGKGLRADVKDSDVKGSDVKATEDGDTIRFERPGPFGVYKWQKNKSELDEMEQAVWNRQRAQPSAEPASQKRPFAEQD